MIDPLLSPQSYESLTISSAAVALTAPQSKVTGHKPTAAFVSVESYAIRYRLDGVAPTASEGHLMNVGDTVLLSGTPSVLGFLGIRVTSDAIVKVTYFY